MSMQQERPPPAYSQHRSETLTLPAVPTHPLPAPQKGNRLPGIRSLLPEASAATTQNHQPRLSVELSPRSLVEQPPCGSLPPVNNTPLPSMSGRPSRGSNEVDVGSPMDTGSIASVQDGAPERRQASVLSVDDPDVRLAAEALSGLGNPDFARSPTRSLNVSNSPATLATEPEPLLSLITSNHPWLGGTINGSISAYNTTKGFSPRFVKYGAELIERNIGSPVVNTVSSVGRRTGVEKNIRRYLGDHQRPSELEDGDMDSSRKRQRMASPSAEAMDIDQAFSPRTRVSSRSSMADSLPAYDDQRSPAYEEATMAILDHAKGKDLGSRVTQDRRVNWSTQLIMTTSGLGAALSESSLNSLKYCLGLLRKSTKHIDSTMHALKLLLDDYEAARKQAEGEAGAMDVGSPNGSEAEREEQVRKIAERMKTLSSDIWKTLETVTTSVSRYAGGALPQNARQVVRTQLLSMPQRWQSASQSAAGAERGEEARGAQRMLAFAKEGLDMMGQVTTVVDGTVQSAEGWLSRMGRRPQQNGEASAARPVSEKAALTAAPVDTKQ